MDDKPNADDLRSNGIFLFAYDVDEESAADAITFILEANLKENPSYDHLTLIINSHGGVCSDGFSLIDVISGSKLPIHTVGLGIIASMGLLIFMAGKRGHRSLTPNTMILTHQFTGVNWGKEHELVASRKRNDLLSKMIINHYKKCTKLNEKDIRKYLLPPEDVWLSAEDALKYNICDEIRYL